jgi:uncharacterized membrane protein (UPF0127 family)
MVLVNATRKTVISDQCRFANSVLKRMVGLLNRKQFLPGEGLLFDRCYGIHTFGMRFRIDVVFLDKEYKVIRTVRALPPFRTCAVRHAIYVLELPVGSIDRSGTVAGDQIQVRTSNQEPACELKATPASAERPACR